MYLFEKLYQTLTLVFDHVSKHLELSLRNSAAPHFSTSVLCVWKHDQTLVRVFGILHIVGSITNRYISENDPRSYEVAAVTNKALKK